MSNQRDFYDYLYEAFAAQARTGEIDVQKLFEGCGRVFFPETALTEREIEIKRLQEQVDKLKEEIEISNNIIHNQNRTLSLIPSCPIHGASCLPWIDDWILKARGLGGNSHE